MDDGKVAVQIKLPEVHGFQRRRVSLHKFAESAEANLFTWSSFMGFISRAVHLLTWGARGMRVSTRAEQVLPIPQSGSSTFLDSKQEYRFRQGRLFHYCWLHHHELVTELLLLFLFMHWVWGSFPSFPMKKREFYFTARHPCLSSDMVNIEVGTQLNTLQ